MRLGKFLRDNALEEDRPFYTSDVIRKNGKAIKKMMKEAGYPIPEGEEYLWHVLPLRIGWEPLEDWREEAYREAVEVVRGEGTVRGAIGKLTKHVKETVEFKPTKDRGYRVLGIQKKRDGTCSEHSIFYTALARSVGIPTRLAVNPGEDHVWAESWDCETREWLHVDPSEGIVGDPGFYEREWKKEISYVYAPLCNGEREDLTKRYTETGTLELPPDSSVSVFSKWWGRPEVREKHKTTFDAILAYEAKGKTEIEIGDGNYDLYIKQGRLVFLLKDVEVKAGKRTKVNLTQD